MSKLPPAPIMGQSNKAAEWHTTAKLYINMYLKERGDSRVPNFDALTYEDVEQDHLSTCTRNDRLLARGDTIQDPPENVAGGQIQVQLLQGNEGSLCK